MAQKNKFTALRTMAVVLLLFNGIGALYGGYSLMNDPTGARLKLPPDYLKEGIFTDYFIPGLILFIVNGAGSLLAALYTIGRFKYYYHWICTQGVVLLIWIMVQVLMVRFTYYLQFLLGGMGLMLVVLALIIKNKEEGI